MRGISRIETLLSLITTSADPTEELIRTYIRLVGDRSFSNFQKILDLKGIRKVEQNAIMDAFVALTSQEASLDDSSFLTTLDMDTTNLPAQTQSQSGFLSFGIQPGTPPPNSTARFSMDQARNGASNAGEATAQRAFSDLRRFGSMLVGRRDYS